MTYENGKWTIYTKDNTKFEISEEQFKEIFEEFTSLADAGNQPWFDKVLGETIAWQWKRPSLSIPTNEDITYTTLEEEIDEVVNNIEENYYLIPVTSIKDRF